MVAKRGGANRCGDRPRGAVSASRPQRRSREKTTRRLQCGFSLTLSYVSPCTIRRLLYFPRVFTGDFYLRRRQDSSVWGGSTLSTVDACGSWKKETTQEDYFKPFSSFEDCTFVCCSSGDGMGGVYRVRDRPGARPHKGGSARGPPEGQIPRRPRQAFDLKVRAYTFKPFFSLFFSWQYVASLRGMRFY